MYNRLFGFSVPVCFLDTPGDSGGGGGASGSASSGGNVPSGGGSGASAPFTMTEDSMFVPPGSDKAVRYGDWSKQYVPKADFTRSTQTYSQQLKAANEQAATHKAELDRIRQAATGASPTPGQTQAQEFSARLADIANRPYVDGKTAAGLVQEVVQSMSSALQQRDAALTLMYKKLQGMDETVGAYRNDRLSGGVQSTLDHAVKTIGLPDAPVVGEFLNDIYLSHTGWGNGPEEFTTMAKGRWTQLVAAVRAWDKSQAQAERAKMLGIPTRGGSAAPSGQGRRKFESPEDIAKTWFPIISDPGT